jgi:choline monooxygenase
MKLDDFVPTADLSRARTLPARWYTDPALLELEKVKIFWRTWQPVGQTEQVQRSGDFFTCELVGEPLVVMRGVDGVLRAFYNVCRHRAAAVACGRGNRRSLQCQYHGWTYGMDGRLISAPEFEGVLEWNKEEVSLAPVRVETWGPFVFVNLDPAAPALLEILGEIPEQVGKQGFTLEGMRAIERRDYTVECNWKVYIDNYLEGYHIPIAHPGLYRELDYDQYKVANFRYFSSQHAPIRPAKEGEIRGRDRRYLRTEAETAALYYWIFPNWVLNLYPDNLSINIVLPLGHQRTLTIFEWYFQGPGSGAGWESMQQGIQFSDEIQREDIGLCEMVQKGLASRSYDQGRFSVKRENGVHHFHLLLHEFLTA